MTGFARVQTESPAFSLTVGLKSVNHRYLDIQMKLPPELEASEINARRLVKKKIARGYLQINTTLELRGTASVRFKRNIVEGYLSAYRVLAEQQGLPVDPDLNFIFRLPGMVTMGEPDAELSSEIEKALLVLVERALEQLTQVREREAADIVADLNRRSQSIEAAVDRIEQLHQGLTPALADWLSQKLSVILKKADLDPQRVLQEAALLADRSDVSEEIQRLRSHNRQLRELIALPGEVGKKMDFLMQEMNREANTLVSKTSGIGEAGLQITDLGLALKAEIEKIREQAMNLE